MELSRQPQICYVNTPSPPSEIIKRKPLSRREKKKLQLGMDGCDWCLLLMHCWECTQKNTEKKLRGNKGIFPFFSSDLGNIPQLGLSGSDSAFKNMLE